MLCKPEVHRAFSNTLKPLRPIAQYNTTRPAARALVDTGSNTPKEPRQMQVRASWSPPPGFELSGDQLAWWGLGFRVPPYLNFPQVGGSLVLLELFLHCRSMTLCAASLLSNQPGRASKPCTHLRLYLPLAELSMASTGPAHFNGVSCIMSDLF